MAKIDIDEVITFCLHLMNKMRGNLIKIRSCAIFSWFHSQSQCFQVDLSPLHAQKSSGSRLSWFNRSDRFCSYFLTFGYRQICSESWVFEKTLIELRFNIVKNLLCLFFIYGFRTMCNLQKRLIRAVFWVLLSTPFSLLFNDMALL